MANDKTRPRVSGTARVDIYRKAAASLDAVPVRGNRSGRFQKAPSLTSRTPKVGGTAGRPAPGVRSGTDAAGGTESAAAKRRHVGRRPAGGRRPEEGGSPRGRRGAKRRAAELGSRVGTLPPDSVPGVVYQHGGGTDRTIDHGGARRGPGGRLRTVVTTPSGATRADSRGAKRTLGGGNRPATGRKRTPRSA